MLNPHPYFFAGLQKYLFDSRLSYKVPRDHCHLTKFCIRQRHMVAILVKQQEILFRHDGCAVTEYLRKVCPRRYPVNPF